MLNWPRTEMFTDYTLHLACNSHNFFVCSLLFLSIVIPVVEQSELLKGDKKEMDDSLFL